MSLLIHGPALLRRSEDLCDVVLSFHHEGLKDPNQASLGSECVYLMSHLLSTIPPLLYFLGAGIRGHTTPPSSHNAILIKKDQGP